MEVTKHTESGRFEAEVTLTQAVEMPRLSRYASVSRRFRVPGSPGPIQTAMPS